jgi:3-oxoacyl-[acyl-carrier-protein] synthase-3
MFAAIRAVAYHLPSNTVSNEDLARDFPDWSLQKVAAKTGIDCRHLAASDECASDLAEAAARKLFATGIVAPEQIDYLLFCTQSPDHPLPTTACLLQHRLGLPTEIGALDFNLGCSGFVYGLGLAKGLIETAQASRVLLLTGETYSKFLDPNDRGVRTIFGDGAAAALIEARRDAPETGDWIGPFVYGTDGRGKDNLIVQAGGARSHWAAADYLYMNGPEIFSFTLDSVPRAIETLLKRTGLSIDTIDYFVFHQANIFMLEHLRQKIGIAAEKFLMAMRHCGNTVSSTIPIVLNEASRQGRFQPGQRIALVGFGVGYSWAATLIRWAG